MLQDLQKLTDKLERAGISPRSIEVKEDQHLLWTDETFQEGSPLDNIPTEELPFWIV